MSTSEHPAPPTTDTKRGGVSWLLWTILLLPLLYVLSLGPVAGYYARTPKRPPQVIVAFYSPLDALLTAVPLFRPLAKWYMDFWLPNSPPPPATTPPATPTSSNTPAN